MVDETKSVLCRACLESGSISLGNVCSLFDSSKQWAAKLQSLTSLDVKPDDGLPAQICSTCLLELENAFRFKQKCLSSYQLLLSSQCADPTTSDHPEVPIKDEHDFDCDFLEEDELALTEYFSSQKASNSSDPEQLIIKPELLDHDGNILVTEEPIRKSRAIDLKLECHDCGGFFKSKCKMRVHWKKVHMKEQLICTICNAQFATFRALNSHAKRKLKSCAIAAKVNIVGKGRNRVFHCKECEYKSLRLKDIGSHLVTHTGDREYRCDLCGKLFSQQSSLQGHKEIVHKIFIKEGTCPFCGKFLQGRNNYYRHLQRHRTPEFACKICDKKFVFRASLNQHLVRHTGVKNFFCEICPAKFFTINELLNHKRMAHLKNKNYLCNICGFKTLYHTRITQHRRKHTNDNVACEICGRFVDNLEQLSLHKKRHFERDFQCEECKSTFFSKKNLQSHIRKVHRKVMIYDKKPILFNDNKNVKIEIKIDTPLRNTV